MNVSEFAPAGVGLYQATASSDGCTTPVWIRISGRSPFTTVLGLAATGTIALGLILQGLGVLRGFGGRGGRILALAAGIPTGLGVCVLAQQHGAIPATTEWMSGLSLASVGVGGVGHLLGGRKFLSRDMEIPVATSAPEAVAPASPPATPEPAATPPAAETEPSTAGEGAPADGIREIAEEDPPRSAYARLDAPPATHAGEPMEVVIGISAKPTPGVVGGEMHRPPTSVGSYVLSVEVVADGFTIGSGENWRNNLSVTAENPYPSFNLHLAANAQETDVEARSIQAIYAVEGQTIGLAVRPVAVLKDQSVVTNVSSSETQPVNISIPSDQQAPDMTIRILIPQEDKPGSLHVSIDTPFSGISLPEGSFNVEIGQDAATYAANLVKQVGAREGQPGLYEFLLGTGKEIAAQLPQAFWDSFAQVAAKTAGRPPAILILTQEPYIPWELAVLDELLDESIPPFLAAQANVGRWILADRGPKLPPPSLLEVRNCAVVKGAYSGPDGQRLLEAEEEGRILEETYQASPVNADMREVLDCLKGIPPAEVLHFAVHGRYDPGEIESGLALVDGTVLAAQQIRSRTLEASPLVFLNACQVGSADEVLGDYSGIAAAFLYAGASGVVAPLWSVQDVLAKDIALRFYQRAFEGRLPAEVFREERGAFLDSPDTTSAAYLAYQFYGHPALKIDRRV